MSKVPEQILAIATALFIEKGYNNVSIRDMAAAANVNVAMFNYYFSSKTQLFDIIFDKAFESMASNIIPEISGEMSVLNRIHKFIYVYIDGIMQNPAIPGFILNELFVNPKRISVKISQSKELSLLWQQFCLDVKKEASEGEIRKDTDPIGLLVNIVSLSLFPVVAKPIIKEVSGIDDVGYVQFLTTRKSEVYNLIKAYLLVK